MATAKIRLDALLSRFGYCSRREAAQWIKSGRVTCAEIPLKNPADKVAPEDVLIDKLPVEFPHGVFVALNKPLGYTCSHDEEEGDIIYDILPHKWTYRNPVVSSVGRLDKETSGLILLTDDGKLNHQLSSPKYHLAKIYSLTTEQPIPASAAELFASGTLMLPEERSPLKPAELRISSPHSAEITLHEGRYHQVRRMMDFIGAPLTSLQRIAIGKLYLNSLNLAEGDWREITLDDIV